MTEANAAPAAQAPKYDADWLPIHKALPVIIGAIQPIAKKRENTQQSYKFRGVDDVYAMLNLLLAKYGVSIRPEVTHAALDSFQAKSGSNLFRSTMRVRYHLTAGIDGSTLTCEVPGEGMDSGDKATPKALSCAYKYMAFQLFCIPTGEKIDTEEESHETENVEQKLRKSLAEAKDLPAVEKVAADIAKARTDKHITDQQAVDLRPLYIERLHELQPKKELPPKQNGAKA